MSLPAPCPTTTTGAACCGMVNAPSTAPRGVSISIRSIGGRLRSVSGTLYLGTSGFAYKEWKGPFYPEGLKDREMLPYFASKFRSVEINYTFRRQPSEKTIA